MLNARHVNVICVKVDVTNIGIVETVAQRFCVGFEMGDVINREIVQNISPGDSSPRTGSVWLVFVTCEKMR